MSARLDYMPAPIFTTPIVGGAPVKSGTFQDIAQAVNYVRAKGATLVATLLIEEDVTASATRTYKFRVAPGTLSKSAIWLIGLRGTLAATTATVKVPAGGSGVAQSCTPGTANSVTVQAYFDPATAVTSYTERELSFSVTAPSTGTVTVVWAACYESPRQYIDTDSTEYGVDVTGALPSKPIIEVAGRSYWQSGAAAIDAAKYNARRCSLYHWYSDTGFSNTSGTYTKFVPDVALLNRKLFSGETSRNIRIRIHAAAAGAIGNVRFTTSSFTTTINVPIGGVAWAPTTGGAPASLPVDSEDLAQATGLQSGSYKTMACEIRRGASGSCTIYGLSVFEDPLDC